MGNDTRTVSTRTFLAWLGVLAFLVVTLLVVTSDYVAYYGSGIQVGPVFIDWFYWNDPSMWTPGA